MTVHFVLKDRPIWTNRPLSRDRPLPPFWTAHFGPDSFFIDPLTFLFQGKPFLLDSSIPEDEATLAELKQWQIPVDQLTAEQLGETQVNLDGKFY